MAIKISGATVIDDNRNLVNINAGLGVGIQSAGIDVAHGITALNFIGAGNTFSLNGNIIDISISGSSGGGGESSGVTTSRAFSNPQNLPPGTTEFLSGISNYGQFGPITIGSSSTLVVESGSYYTIM